ncbi:hypothetical protein NKR23_g11294 [Pleurostoma richardsiae]|uniref:Ribosomal protein S35, mitochondrial n=1 Tax=Pleurostoma richardsiae TaxID=41990 RepID=A0AA38R1J5_9PEZI|nr:hypothetical protein NKR23_g11294 [Pleurostoma richardsiae]
MPPRVPSQCLRACAESAASHSRCPPSTARHFSSTPPASRRMTKNRRTFFRWLETQGKAFEKHEPGSGPSYLKNNSEATNQPFPENPQFRSLPVLSDDARETIWRKIMREGEAVKTVSAEYGVDMRRIAAVVRLKEAEKDWIARGQPMAKPYAKAVMEMLPSTDLRPGRLFEPINEIYVHSYTTQQVFLPTAESRHFTRKDAAKAFHPNMLSPDERVPHPELIQLERDILDGKDREESFEKFKAAAIESERAAAEKVALRARKEQERTTKVDSGRFQFRFKDINVDDVGKDGRSRHGTGWRYGVPFYDRKKGTVKIPTEVA